LGHEKHGNTATDGETALLNRLAKKKSVEVFAILQNHFFKTVIIEHLFQDKTDKPHPTRRQVDDQRFWEWCGTNGGAFTLKKLKCFKKHTL